MSNFFPKKISKKKHKKWLKFAQFLLNFSQIFTKMAQIRSFFLIFLPIFARFFSFFGEKSAGNKQLSNGISDFGAEVVLAADRALAVVAEANRLLVACVAVAVACGSGWVAVQLIAF
jgi:HJR/Mrr/RecB family endonuclease